ncbi:MAG: dephospho-CoA kinase [Chloroflexi bacterium]|nr:MAG: dephospho-CoA kinase [Chloroflexota bacterium]
MPYILGLTGNIASGKSTVGLMLLEMGADIYIDADRVVHELYLPGQPLVAELAGVFGSQIVDQAGGIDRKILGQIVFGNPTEMRRLEQIVHPAVQTALMSTLRQLDARRPDAVGVLDAVKLVESGYGQLLESFWLVICSPAVQLERLVKLRGIPLLEAELRLQSQPDLESKRAQAAEIIDNSGDLDQLRHQVSAAWKRFMDGIRARESTG